MREPRSGLIAFSVVGVLTGALVSEALSGEPCSIDEPAWITSGYRTWELLRDASPPAEWERAYDALGLGDFGNKNPPLGKLFVGLTVAAFKRPGDSIRYAWQWPWSYEENASRGRLPPSHLLMPARAAIALLAGLLLWLCYLITRELTGRPLLSVAAPCVLFVTPVFEFHATHVYMDVPQLTAAAGAVFAGLRAVRSSTDGRWRWWLLTALLGGVACAVKFSAGAFVAAFGLHALSQARRFPAGALLMGAVPVAVFIAVNPYLYPAPAQRTLELVRSWSQSKSAQQADRWLAQDAVHSPLIGVLLTAARGALRPTATPPFKGRALEQLRAHGLLLLLGSALTAAALAAQRRVRLTPDRRAWLSVLLAVGVAWALEFTLLGGPGVLSALAAVGCVGLWRARDDRVVRIYGLIWLVVFFSVGAWLPFDWARYYLPVVLLTVPIYVVGGLQLRRLFTVPGGPSSR